MSYTITISIMILIINNDNITTIIITIIIIMILTIIIIIAISYHILPTLYLQFARQKTNVETPESKPWGTAPTDTVEAEDSELESSESWSQVERSAVVSGGLLKEECTHQKCCFTVV